MRKFEDLYHERNSARRHMMDLFIIEIDTNLLTAMWHSTNGEEGYCVPVKGRYLGTEDMCYLKVRLRKYGYNVAKSKVLEDHLIISVI